MVMKNKKIKIFVSVIIILILVLVVVFFLRNPVDKNLGKYDSFATCLKDKGAVFYGAFWCPHCQAEKKLFGSSEKLLPYVECSTPDAQDQTQICKDKKILGYPTWMLKDGTIIPNDSTNGSGVKLETLAEKTSCVLPQ